ARGELHGGVVRGDRRYRAGAVGERAEREQLAAVHELRVPGPVGREVLRRQREVSAVIEKHVPLGFLHVRLPPFSRAPRAALIATNALCPALPCSRGEWAERGYA